MYEILKTTHLTCVLLTYVLFFIRGVWLLQDSERLSATWVRVIPHVVDTFLLASAIGLVWITHQYPGVQLWLTVKIIALVAYIGLGIMLFRVCRTRPAQLVTWIGAQLVFFYMVLVALTRNPFLNVL